MATKTKAKTKSKSKGSSGSSSLSQQVAAEAFLRTNPERSTLAEQLAQARSDRGSAIGAATTAANANVTAARAAPAAFQKVHDDAAGRVTSAVAVPGADNPLTGAGRDAAQTRGHLAEMLALSNTDAKRRELTATEGQQYAVNQANAGFDKTSGTISSRLRALAQEQGVYSSGRLGELTDKQLQHTSDVAQKSADRKTSLATAGVNPDGTIVPGGPKDPKVTGKGKTNSSGAKPASPDAVKQGRSAFATAKGSASDLKTAGFKRPEAAAMLTKGQKGAGGKPVYEQVKDAKGKVTNRRKLNPDGTQVTSGSTPDIPQITDPLFLSVALDIVYDGGVSRANVKKLHDAGYDVKSLGVPTQTQRGKMRRPTLPTTAKLSPAARAPGGT